MPMPTLRALLLVVCAAAAMAPTRVAAADPPDKAARAKELYESAVRNFNVGRFTEAANDFTAAYEISGREDLLFNIAQSWRQAKNYEKALFFYKSYMAAFRRRGEWPPERELIERRMAEAEQAIAAAQSRMAAAEQAIQSAHDAREKQSGKEPSAQPRPVARVQPAPPRPPPRWLRPVGIALLAGGVAGLAVGGAMAGLARGAADDVQHAGGEFDRALYDKQQLGMRYDAASIGLFVAGGALVVAGAVPLALSFRRHARAYALSPTVAPGALGLSFSGRY